MAKAMEKDKTRRYASAGDLASDIRRYLRGEAILARPASALYRLRKFTRRHRALVVGVSGIFAALVAGTVVSIAFAACRGEAPRVATNGSVTPLIRATAPGSRPRLPRSRITTLSMPPAISMRPRRPLREWEWRHLRSRLDDSTIVFTAAPGESRFLIALPRASGSLG